MTKYVLPKLSEQKNIKNILEQTKSNNSIELLDQDSSERGGLINSGLSGISIL